MSSIQRCAVGVAAALSLAAPAYAQQTAPVEAGHALLAPSLFAATIGSPRLGLDSAFATTLVSPRLGLDAAEAAVVVPVFQSGPRESQDVAMMIVGGAALVVGAVIDGDAGTIIMIGGGTVGLIGLYRYLQ